MVNIKILRQNYDYSSVNIFINLFIPFFLYCFILILCRFGFIHFQSTLQKMFISFFISIFISVFISLYLSTSILSIYLFSSSFHLTLHFMYLFISAPGLMHFFDAHYFTVVLPIVSSVFNSLLLHHCISSSTNLITESDGAQYDACQKHSCLGSLRSLRFLSSVDLTISVHTLDLGVGQLLHSSSNVCVNFSHNFSECKTIFF